MKGRPLLPLLALLCMVMSVRSADYTKLSTHVRSIIINQEVQAAQSRNLHHINTKGRRSLAKQQERLLTAFVRIAPADGLQVLEDYGCKIYAQQGDVVIASIPLSNLGALSDHPSVHRIEASPSSHLTMDTTVTITGVDKIQNPDLRIPHSPYTGKGVVVGVMDVGFDLTHPNFYDPLTHRYRISALWDQLSPDTVGSEFPVGRDFVGPDAVREQQRSYDGLIQGHGTHTLGIAAGSGYDSPYRGIAYDADICLVSNAINGDIDLIDSTDYDKYTTAVDGLGFKYIFDYADRQHKPCVASLSEGYTPFLDEEDVLYAYFLYNLLGPGHIIVASAGNQSIVNTYMKKAKDQAEAGAFINTPGDSAYYKIKTKDPLSLSLYAFTDENSVDVLHLLSSAFGDQDQLIDTLFINNHADTCAIQLERYESKFGSDTIYTIQLIANKPFNEMPDIAMVFDGADTEAELYGSLSYALKGSGYAPKWVQAEIGHNVLAPGCFPSVICVGATAHRLGFTNYEGNYQDKSAGMTVGLRSNYSSYGPAMTGMQKPEVVAPGNNIISSFSSFYIEDNPDRQKNDVAHFDYEGRTYAWTADTGTSMSAPVVAGIIALWLQANPNLNTNDIRDIMEHTCRHPVDTLDYPNDQYGYGEIDAYRGLLYVLGLDSVDGISHHQPSSATLRLQGRQLYVNGATQGSLAIYSTNGRQLLRRPLTDSPIDLSILPPGVYAVQINAVNSSESGSVLIVVDGE